jgi:hypothetical protein
MLSQDPNSLANLDQGSLSIIALETPINVMHPDLPNNLQAQVPIVSQARFELDTR